MEFLQHALDGDRRVTKIRCGENLAVLSRRVVAIQLDDAIDVALSQFLALGAQALAHLLEKIDAVDQDGVAADLLKQEQGNW